MKAALAPDRVAAAAKAGPETACLCVRDRVGELRCGCGSLLARRVEGRIEVKCRRCKRTILLDVADG